MRTFLAVDIDEDTRRKLAGLSQRIETAGARVNWVAPENLHVTLNFLGEVGDADLSAVCNAAAEGAGGVQGFEFDVRGVLAVPPRGRQLRMFWAGVEDPDGRMGQLYSRLSAALAELGYPPDSRTFRPHITLARFKSARDPDAVRRAAETFQAECFGTVRATEVVVYSSQLTPQGPIYAPLSRAVLGRG